jgi:5'(3')-deoxyribonucleotidase
MSVLEGDCLLCDERGRESMGDTRPTLVDVGVDVDGVLCDHVRGLCVRILQRYGIRLTPRSVTEWDLDFGPSSIGEEIRVAYGDDDFLLSLPPVKGAQEAISSLAGTGNVRATAVTSRPRKTQRATTLWLRKHFPGLSLTYSVSKERLPIGILVDDFPPFVEKFASAGKAGILFSRPWNRKEQSRLRRVGGIAVVRGWSHGVRVVKRLAGARGGP